MKSAKELTVSEMTALNEAFSKSDLPIKVHVSDLLCISPEFMAEIEDELVEVI